MKQDLGYKQSYWFSFCLCFSLVPSKAPCEFQVFANSSRTVVLMWRLPPANSTNGILEGFKLIFKKKDSKADPVIRRIRDVPKGNNALTVYTVNGLDENTEYQFQVSAFTFAGDGVKSLVQFAKTMEGGE